MPTQRATSLLPAPMRRSRCKGGSSGPATSRTSSLSAKASRRLTPCRTAIVSSSRRSAGNGSNSIANSANASRGVGTPCALEPEPLPPSRRNQRRGAQHSASRLMAKTVLPTFIPKPAKQRSSRSCPAHRAWDRKHYCSVPGCKRLPIECAHVRNGTDGGIGLRPSDKWTVSLCADHHREQHLIGEVAFEQRYDVDLSQLAEEFAR